jgi:uncharacterized repeat protein (TIGR01451 family)
VYIEPVQMLATGVQVFADFDPSRLEILSVVMPQSSLFDVELSSDFDNVVGTLNVSAGTLGQNVGSPFKMATISYRAKQITGMTGVSLSGDSPRDTVASIIGQPILTFRQAATISIRRPSVVDLRIQPESIDVDPGQVFELELIVEPNGETVTGVQAFLNFDPQTVTVLSVSPAKSSPLNLVLANSVDNLSGDVDFAVGSLTNSANASFALAHMTLQAGTSRALSEIGFATEFLRSTTASVGGDSVHRGLFGSQIKIQSPLKLSVEKDVTPTFPELGDTVTYTVRVKNEGPVLAESITMVDPLPDVVDYVSVTSTQGACDESANVVTCELGDIPEGQTVLVTIVTVNVLDIELADELRNIVTVFSGPTDVPEAQAAADLPSMILVGLLTIATGLCVGIYAKRRRHRLLTR